MHRGSYGSPVVTVQEPGSPVDARNEAPLASPRIMATQPASDRSPVGWNPRTLAVAAFVALFLMWQLVVPTVALFGPRPERFGWHMYSTVPDLPKAWIVDALGAEAPVEVREFFGKLRAEIDFAAALRAGLCDASGANAVKVVDRSGATEVVDCP